MGGRDKGEDLLREVSRADDALSVSEITARIKELLEGSLDLRAVRVSGEASNVTYAASGHLYFSLKDENAQIPAVMFKGDLRSVSFKVENGMQVVVGGGVRVYAPHGKYQLYAQSIEKAGQGDLLKQLEELKKKLAKEGLFDQTHKKALPAYPLKIGVVTSGTGAVRRDIENVLARRWPVARMVLAPVSVQGEKAAGEIAAGLQVLDAMGLDVIIVGRGGGSIEDLWCFNDESLARAIFAAKTPVVSAVGHEIDFTIADFVADVRAATPTEAAELATPDAVEVRQRLGDLAEMMVESLDAKVEGMRDSLDEARRVLLRPLPRREGAGHQLERLQWRMNELMNQRYAVIEGWRVRLRQRLIERSPWARVEESRSLMNRSLHRAEMAVRERLGRSHLRLERDGRRIEPILEKRRRETALRLSAVKGRLEALSPTAVLSRGYAVVFDAEGHALKSSESVAVGEAVGVRLHKGELSCRVEKKN